MELADGGKPPCLGARGQALRRQASQPGAQKGAIGAMQRHALGGGEGREILQIRLIGGQCIARRAAFGGQHFQKRLDMAGKPRPGGNWFRAVSVHVRSPEPL